jgi:dephospho-CoA kinase
VRSFIIAGLPGAGKTTAKQYAEQLGYTGVSLGETVREAYEICGREESIAEFVLRTHETNGRAAFARQGVTTLKRHVANRDGEPSGVVVEGVHSPASVSTIREMLGETSVVWIVTPGSVRLERLRQREDGYATVDLLRRDLRELNSGMAELAAPLGHDCCVRNGGSRRSFERRLDSLF